MEPLATVKRIGIIGGSYDPVHRGHLAIAQDAADHLSLSDVLFVPAALPPHKQHILPVDAEHRLNMLSLAVEADDRFSVSDMEIRRGGVSYTVDTVQQLRETQPDAELYLIVGSDTLLELHTWYRIGDLLDMCTVAAAFRPGAVSIDAIWKKLQLPERYRDKIVDEIIAVHRMEISSTQIRKRVAGGETISNLVPAAVDAYIEKHGLYQR